MTSFFNFDIFFVAVSIMITFGAMITIMSAIAAARTASRKASQRSNFTYPPRPVTKTNSIHTERFSHDAQINYSEAYSINNTVKDPGIKDKPLTEAEKNVLYGK